MTLSVHDEYKSLKVNAFEIVFKIHTTKFACLIENLQNARGGNDL